MKCATSLVEIEEFYNSGQFPFEFYCYSFYNRHFFSYYHYVVWERQNVTYIAWHGVDEVGITAILESTHQSKNIVNYFKNSTYSMKIILTPEQFVKLLLDTEANFAKKLH